MWTQNNDYAERGEIKRYAKRHPRETASCFENLSDVISALDAGCVPTQMPFGFYSSEGADVYRIGQTGVKHPCESRLYVYSCIINEVVYVLTMGDKTTQSDDINRAKAIVRKIKSDVQDKKSEERR